MDRLERIEHPHMALLTAFEGLQAGLWTALPGIIQSFDPAKKTAVIQVAIQMELLNDETGEKTNIDIAPLLDCPVYFPSGGGVTFTFPVKLGDECLVIFACRCIDAWWQSGGYKNPQADFRMHDLSDGFAFVGISSVPNVPANISATNAQIRSNDGSMVLDFDPVTHNITATCPVFTINGNVHCTGTVTSDVDVIGGGKSLKSHKHGGVTTGSGTTGVPV